MAINPNSNPESQEEEWEVLSYDGGEEGETQEQENDDVEPQDLDDDDDDDEQSEKSTPPTEIHISPAASEIISPTMSTTSVATEEEVVDVPQLPDLVGNERVEDPTASVSHPVDFIGNFPHQEPAGALVTQEETEVQSLILSPKVHSDAAEDKSSRNERKQGVDETTPFVKTGQDDKMESTTQQSAPDDIGADNRADALLLSKIPEASAPSEGSSSREPSVGGFFESSLRFIGDAVNELDDKHHIRRKTRNSFKTIGNAIQDIDDQHHIRRKTRNSFKTIGNAVQDIDDKHHIRRKTRNSLKTILTESQRGLQQVGDSARHVSQLVQGEADRLQVDEKAKAVAEKAKAAGQKAITLNEELKITDKLAVAAVIGAGILMAKGNGRAGAAVLASGGATYMAGEAMRSQYRHDSGLNENVGHHL